MKFNIIKTSVTYGGPPSVHDTRVIHRDVSADFVKGFFENITLDKNFETPHDNMGCFSIYEIKVSSLS